MSEKHWWEEPLRILDYVSFSAHNDIDLDDYVAQCGRLHVNAVHYQAADTTGGGLDEYSFQFECRHSKKRNRDLLKEGVPALHAAGVKVIVYLDGHQFPKPFGEEHPDWWVIKEDGSRVEHLYGSDDLTFCINSPWRTWSYEVMEDICAYEIDGFLYDGPLAFLGDRACYCPSCLEKFRGLYGRAMPHWDESNLADWKLLVEFQDRSMQDYYRDAYETVKPLRPEALVYLNGCNEFETSWLRGRRNRSLMPYQDAMISEGGFHYTRLLDNRFHTAIASKLYETQAGGKPAVNAVSPAFGMWRLHALSGPEIRILLAEASTGASPYMAVYHEARDNTPGIDAAAEVLGFLEKHEDYYSGTKSVAKTALLYSTQTVDFYRGGADTPRLDISGIQASTSEQITAFNRSFEGYFDMLVRSRAPFDVIDETVIEEGGLDKYSLLVLPNCACISDSQCKAITQFVDGGGGMVAEFETSRYDEWGVMRDGFGLGQLFGVEPAGQMIGPRRWDFAYAGEGSLSYFADLEQPIMPAPHYNLTLKNVSADKLILLGEQLVSNVPAAYPVSDEPLLTVNAHGGGKVFYFSGLVGDAYKEHHFSPYLSVFRSILKHEAHPQVEISGPPHLLHVNLRRSPKKHCLLLYLVNYEISSVDQVIPARDLRITVHGATGAQSVKALKSGESLAFERSGDSVTFSLPRLDEYEVVAIG